jgi:hypothetical protein
MAGIAEQHHSGQDAVGDTRKDWQQDEYLQDKAPTPHIGAPATGLEPREAGRTGRPGGSVMLEGRRNRGRTGESAGNLGGQRHFQAHHPTHLRWGRQGAVGNAVSPSRHSCSTPQ